MSEWQKTSLRDLIVIKNGKDHKKLKNGQYPVYGSGGIMRYADSYLYDQESVLLPRKGTLNNIQFVTEPFWTVDTCYYTVVNRDKVLPYFLYCCLCKMDIQSLNTGSAVPSMTFEKYYSIEVPIPPLSTQHRIANILSRYDSLIENYQKHIKLLEEAARRLYKEWFIDLRFPRHENTKIVDGLPEGWERKKVADVVVFYDKMRKPLSSMQRQSMEKIYPYYGAASLMDYVDNYLFDGTYLLMGEDGTVISNEKYPMLQYVWGKFWVSNHAHVLQGKEPYSTEFIYMMLKQMTILDVVTGAAQPKISQGRLAAKEIIMPANELVKEYDKIVVPMIQQAKSLQSQIRLLTEARDRLLPKLMSGEITV